MMLPRGEKIIREGRTREGKGTIIIIVCESKVGVLEKITTEIVRS